MAHAETLMQEGLEGAAGVVRPGLEGDALQNEAIALASLSKISNTRWRETIDITL